MQDGPDLCGYTGRTSTEVLGLSAQPAPLKPTAAIVS